MSAQPRDAALIDLQKQARTTAVVAPRMPLLGAHTKGTCHPSLQAAIEKYDEEMRVFHLQALEAGVIIS